MLLVAMTRIIVLRFFFVFVGLILLSSGETAQSVTSEPFSEDRQPNSSSVENKRLFISSETDLASTEADFVSQKSNTELYSAEKSTDPPLTLLETPKESNAPIDPSVSFTQYLPNSSVVPSAGVDNDSLDISQSESDASTTLSVRSATQKRSDNLEDATHIPKTPQTDSPTEESVDRRVSSEKTDLDATHFPVVPQTDSEKTFLELTDSREDGKEDSSKEESAQTEMTSSNGKSIPRHLERVEESMESSDEHPVVFENETASGSVKKTSTPLGPSNPSAASSEDEVSDANNNLEYASSEFVGVTFDPDGMRHNGPQDPDAVVFFKPDSDQSVPPPTKESEEFEIVRESNPEEGKTIVNGSKAFENLDMPERDDTSSVTSKNRSDSISFENGATLPEFKIHNYTLEYSDDSEEMMQDAPFILPGNTQSKPDESVPEKAGTSPTEKTFLASETKDSAASPAAEVGSSEKAQTQRLPDPTIIRPVKVRLSSNIASTSALLPGSFSTAATAVSSFGPTTGSHEETESSSPHSSSPISVLKVEEGNVENLTTQSELENATIAEVAIKTSVSVSLPSSNNGSQIQQPSTSETSSTSNSSVSSIVLTPAKGSNESSVLSSDELVVTTTEAASTGFKIRKPKLKIGGGGPSRQPYVPKRPSGGGPTDAPNQVSIFKKTRTRIASITSSTTARPFRPYSTIRVHYATHHGVAIVPPAGEEWLVSTVPVTSSTEPPTTTTEEPIEEVPFTGRTVMPVLAESADDVILVKVAAYIALDRGIRWRDELDNRQTPEYKRNEALVLMHLERLFRSSSIAPRLWKIEIDGFSSSSLVRPVGVDFFLYLIKSKDPVIPVDHLESAFRERLTTNNTFGTFRVDTDKTAFEVLQEEPLVQSTPPPGDEEEEEEPPIPQWAIACIVIGAASLIFIVLFAAVTLYGRHHMRRRYSSKLSEESGERGSSGEWESKMAAAYENMAADTLYDSQDNTYKKQQPASGRVSTFHGIPSPLRRGDSWSSSVRPPRWTSHFD